MGLILFFKSVFKSNAESIPPCDFRNVSQFKVHPVTSDEVLKELKDIKPSTSTGSDELPATFIINTAEIICHPLSVIFNLSVATGEYPDILKRSGSE